MQKEMKQVEKVCVLLASNARKGAVLESGGFPGNGSDSLFVSQRDHVATIDPPT